MTQSASDSPMVVELGVKKRGAIRELQRGGGPLMEEVARLLDQLRADGRLAKSATPVAVVVKQKRRCRSMLSLLR